MTVATWKIKLFNADAQKCADELNTLDEWRPEEVVNYAKDENTELHKCFDWDDTSAARKYRIEQARTVLRTIVIQHVDDAEEENKKLTSVRMFVNTEHSQGYKKIQLVVNNMDEYEKLKERAYTELRWFKEKYKTIVELKEILDLID